LAGQKSSKDFSERPQRERVLQTPFIANVFLAGSEMLMKYDLRLNGKYTLKRNSKARGFTIVELIIAMVVLAILSMIAIPSFQRLAINGNLKTAARDLIADFNALRQKAMAENQQYDLTFQVGSNTYTVSPASGLPNGGKSPAGIASDIHLDAATTYGMVSFYTRGTLSQNGSVVLKNSRGSTATITCNLSGRTYVQFAWQ
jgi:prepilin-type N-terminal cleavage/methylation domain-containing protein